jgi:hypothetical protein
VPDWLSSLLSSLRRWSPLGSGAPARRALPASTRPSADGDGPPLDDGPGLSLSSAAPSHWITVNDMLRGPIAQQRVPLRPQWLPADVDAVEVECNSGTLLQLATLIDAMRRNGLISGIMDTRTAGMLRLPIQYAGDPFLVELLQGRDPSYDQETKRLVDPGLPGLWTQMAPQAEQSAILWDGILAGVGLGELVPRDPDPPVLRHLELHWLTHRREQDQFHYQTRAGQFQVKPGDGRWVLFTPYGVDEFWRRGKWRPCALPFVEMLGAEYDRLRWQSNLADPLKVIEAGSTADEKHRTGLLDFVRRLWKRAPGLVLPKDYKASLVESNGRGYEVYSEAEQSAKEKIQIALAGQVVTTTGTSGFSNGNIFADIALTLIQQTAEAWSECCHDQILEPWAERWHHMRARAPGVLWDVRSPDRRLAEAKAAAEMVDAIDAANSKLPALGLEVDADAIQRDRWLALPTRPRRAAPALPPSPLAAARLLPARAAAEEDAPIEVEAFLLRTYRGIDVTVDRPAGTVQHGEAPDGTPWERTYLVDYGYVEGAQGGDGEALDVFCGPEPDAPLAWWAVQVDHDGAFDEYKVFLGFDDAEMARLCYAAHIPEHLCAGWFAMPVEALRALLGLEPAMRWRALAAHRRASCGWTALPRARVHAASREGDVDMRPPPAVRDACRRGLVLHADGHSGDAASAIVDWARALSRGEAPTPARLAEMRRWFRRTRAPTPHDDAPTPARVLWLLHGGEAGRAWCERMVRRLREEEAREGR